MCAGRYRDPIHSVRSDCWSLERAGRGKEIMMKKKKRRNLKLIENLILNEFHLKINSKKEIKIKIEKMQSIRKYKLYIFVYIYYWVIGKKSIFLVHFLEKKRKMKSKNYITILEYRIRPSESQSRYAI